MRPPVTAPLRPARPRPARRGRKGAALLALVATLGAGGCGQFGPLRFPGETVTEGRSQADARRLPQGRRDAPVSTTDPANAPTKQP